MLSVSHSWKTANCGPPASQPKKTHVTYANEVHQSACHQSCPACNPANRPSINSENKLSSLARNF